MSGEHLAPLMFFTVLLFILTGYPVAFALGGSSLIFAFIGVQLEFFEWPLLLAIPQRIFGIMKNTLLLAVPFFIFMGTTLEKTKLAEDLLKTIGILFGPVRGGLALAVVFVGTLLAAATGVIGASVVAMGLISLPVMLKYGYSKQLATGVIAASGTLGQIIPPSIVLIVLADRLGVSAGDLFLGALTPGIMLAGLYAFYVAANAQIKPNTAPALPKEVRTMELSKLIRQVMLVMLPPLILIVVVLGSIFIGVATPTEAGAFGALGAMLIAFFSKRLTLRALKETMTSTTRLTSMVAFLLIGSTAFTLVFRGFDGDLWIEHVFADIPGGQTSVLIIANLLIFVLGFFIDFFEIAFIVIPLLKPVFEKMGIDMVWFGVMVGMNLQTSFLTPPFGFALFYLRGVAPKEVRTSDIYKGVIPFIIIQLIGLVLLFRFPQMVHWLIK